MRRKTRQIHVGDVLIGGDAPIAVQSMTTMYTRDVEATLAQIFACKRSGCELVRVAVPERTDALALGAIKRRISIPLIADIHYDPATRAGRHRARRGLRAHQSRQSAARQRHRRAI